MHHGVFIHLRLGTFTKSKPNTPTPKHTPTPTPRQGQPFHGCMGAGWDPGPWPCLPPDTGDQLEPVYGVRSWGGRKPLLLTSTALSWPSRRGFFFNQQTFTKCLLCARYCAKRWGPKKRNKPTSVCTNTTGWGWGGHPTPMTHRNMVPKAPHLLLLPNRPSGTGEDSLGIIELKDPKAIWSNPFADPSANGKPALAGFLLKPPRRGVPAPALGWGSLVTWH